MCSLLSDTIFRSDGHFDLLWADRQSVLPAKGVGRRALEGVSCATFFQLPTLAPDHGVAAPQRIWRLRTKFWTAG